MMNPSEGVTEVSAEVDIVAVNEVKLQNPIRLVDFFSEAPRANIVIPLRTKSADDRKVDF